MLNQSFLIPKFVTCDTNLLTAKPGGSREKEFCVAPSSGNTHTHPQSSERSRGILQRRLVIRPLSPTNTLLWKKKTNKKTKKTNN